MSKFCGKCDLYDHMMMEKTYPDPNNKNILISDELECFEIFKKRTGGVLYQSLKIELTDWNIDYWINYYKDSNKLSKSAYTVVREDKRCKSGKKEITKYNYYYYGTKYSSLKELNERGFYGEIEIKFNTLLDLLPYYPYIITMMLSDKNQEKVYISDTSYVDMYTKDVASYSEPSFRMIEIYREELKKHYVKVITEYGLIE